MATATLAKELTRLHKAASERIDCGQPLVVGDLTPDIDIVRQGDIYLVVLSGVPEGYEPVEKPSAADWQLAIGTTQGSRHVIAESCRPNVRLHRRTDRHQFAGPCMECPEGVTVEHPEHGHIVLPPGVYAVGYQRVWSQEARRVAD